MSSFAILGELIVMSAIFFLPGYITFNALKLREVNLTFLETLFLYVLVSIIITGITAFILAIAGHLNLWILLGLILSYNVLMILKFKSNFRFSNFPKPNIDKKSVFLILIYLATIILFFHPFEDIFGYEDGYIYVNNGIAIAKQGSIVLHYPLLSDIPGNIVTLFGYRGSDLFNGIHITNYTTGELIPRYFHLFHLYISIFYLMFNLTGALYTAPFFGSLAVIAIFLTTKHLFNWRTAALAVSILVVSYLQIWFSRSHSAEIFVQFLIFSAIFVYIIFTKSKNKVLGIISALCFGLLFITKIEMFLVIFVFILYFTGLNVLNKLERHYIYFIGTLIFFQSFASYYYIFYVRRYFFSFLYAPDIPVIPLILVVITIVCVNVIPKKYLNKTILNINQHTRKFQYIFSLFIILFVVYSMTKTSIIGKYGYNLIMLSWYLHPFILALGIIGIILMIYKKPYESTYFFLGIMLIFFFFYISNIHHWWGGPWWMRRYVFAVVPLIYIGVGYFITELSNSFHEKNRKFILSLLALSLIISTLMISSPIIGHVEYKGAIGQVEKIFDSFDDNSVLIFADSRYPPIAYPLWSIYDKNVIYLRQDHWGWVATPRNSEDVDIVLKACAKWNREGKKVYIVNPTDKFINSFKGRLNFDFYRYGKIDVPWLTYSKGEFPTDFRQIVRHIRIYEVKLINE